MQELTSHLQPNTVLQVEFIDMSLPLEFAGLRRDNTNRSLLLYVHIFKSYKSSLHRWNKIHSICPLWKIHLVIWSYLSMKNWRPASDLNSWITMSCTWMWPSHSGGVSAPGCYSPLSLQAPAPPTLISWVTFPGYISTFFLPSPQTTVPWLPSRPKDTNTRIVSPWENREECLPLEEDLAGSGCGLRTIGISS